MSMRHFTFVFQKPTISSDVHVHSHNAKRKYGELMGTSRPVVVCAFAPLHDKLINVFFCPMWLNCILPLRLLVRFSCAPNQLALKVKRVAIIAERTLFN